MNIFLWKFKKNIAKSSTAQQLVEFLLIAPFIIIIFGLLTEFAYALNINMTLNQTLREATSSIYSKIKPNTTAADINSLVMAQMAAALVENNAPVNDLNVDYSIAGSNAFFLATYTYTPAFTLPNLYVRILPESFSFRTVCVVPSAFLQSNTYGAVTSSQLDKIWAGPINFSNLAAFNSSKRGILRASVNSANGYPTANIAFLVNPTAGIYENIGFNGALIGAIPSSVTNVIVSDSATPASWIAGCNPNLELANASQKCELKEALSMTNVLGSQGNFDNIFILTNPLFASENKYKVETYGSRVFVHPSSMSVATLISNLGLYENEEEYGFGTKVAAP